MSTNPSYREDFPALRFPEKRRGCSEYPSVYLDNAATTHKPSIVLDALGSFYRSYNANPYRGPYRASVVSTQLYEGARAVVADFVGADTGEIVFTRNTTEGINLIAHSWALDRLRPGDEVAIPRSEHHSNLVVWQRVCKRRGAQLVYLELDEEGRLKAEEIECKIGSRTKLVACAHISNVLGSVYPVGEIIAHAHDVGAAVLLDCAQSAAHRPLDLHALDADFAAFSGHKLYGPMGIGVLYIKRDLMDGLQPFLLGGEMVESVFDFHATFENGPRRFEAGTPSVPEALGLAAATSYVKKVGWDNIRSVEDGLTERLLSKMGTVDGVRIYGNPCAAQDRSSIVSFNVAGVHPQDVALALDAQGIAVRSGAHCAQPLHRALGIEASCRVSPCLYNTPEEIDAFIDALEGVRRRIARHIMSVFP
ncbi:SufS family cysteine desulfurase [Gordonibacter pamelaeae]|uniref:aminotransferase class V-fold PLP-dependent enzyme n=1 Tax=Gordonibacter pamelaeae TaxID=471189 RepID=UPI002FDFDE0C